VSSELCAVLFLCESIIATVCPHRCLPLFFAHVCPQSVGVASLSVQNAVEHGLMLKLISDGERRMFMYALLNVFCVFCLSEFFISFPFGPSA